LFVAIMFVLDVGLACGPVEEVEHREEKGKEK
jgi:hypothetical protein